MAPTLDLNLLPMARFQGRELSDLPGLAAWAPPKRSARGRESDALLVYLALSGQVSAEEYAEWTERLSYRFYRTSGSVTHALKSAIEELNQTLLKRNLASSGKRVSSIGRLVLGVLRGAQLVLAQSGPTHTFHLHRQGMSHYHDPQLGGRGLGLTQNAQIYLSQLTLQAGDLLISTVALPGGWGEMLQSESRSITPEALRRRLLSGGGDVNAVLMQVQTGQGRVHLLRVGQEAMAVGPAQPEPAVQGPLPEAGPISPPSPSPEISATASASPPSAMKPERGKLTESQSSSPPIAAGPFVRPRMEGEIPELIRPPSKRRRAIYRGAALAIGKGRRWSDRLKAGLQRFLPRLLPAKEGGEVALPSSFMALMAIITPVVVVTLAAIIYFRYGTLVQYQEHMQMAVTALQHGDRAGEVAEARRLWESALYYVERAEQSRRTPDSALVRQQAQSRLDALDSIIRLDFRKALVTSLDKSIQVSRMAATETDLYLLDSKRGRIIRAFLTHQGYEIDPMFRCEAGTYDGQAVGPLIDLAGLPRINAHRATVVGMDARGNLLYCAPEIEPHPLTLAMPERGWKVLTGFTLDTDYKNLYVLDAPAGAVWIYGGKNLDFSSLPFLFFDVQVPKNMDQAIDLAVNGDDLYLLFRDGHVTACTLSRLDVQPTRCRDPLIMIDNRLQHQSGPTLSDAIFTSLMFASPPDPSLYFLEPNTQAIYRFSPRSEGLLLQGQFRADSTLVKTAFTTQASALAISPSRALFLCVGNQVYYATDVP